MLNLYVVINFILITCIISDCVHDEVFSNKNSEYETKRLRNLQYFENEDNILALKNNSNNFKPMRIKYLYINETNVNRTYFSNSYLNLTDMSKETIDRFELDYVEPVRQILQKFLKVYPYDGRIYLDDGLCAYNEPIEYTLGIKNVDLILAYTFEYSEQNYRARSQPCNLGRSIYNRPVTGMTYINLKYMNPSSAITAVEKKLMQITLLHEYVHILGFTPFLYDKFIDDFGNPLNVYIQGSIFNNQMSPFIASSRLTKFTRDYYNCTKAPGMLLESNGVNGTSFSHWSRTLIQNELMTGSSSYNYRILTNFTLKFLDDTGWYKVDYSVAEKSIWGKSKSCNFFEKNDCDNFNEFCHSENTLGCDYDYKFLAVCRNDGLSSCPYNYGFQNCSNIQNLNENNKLVTQDLRKNYPYYIFTDLSRCVMSSYRDSSFLPRCHRITCDIAYKNVKIFIDDLERKRINSVTCGIEEAGRHKSILDYDGYNITFKCPYYTRMCFDQDNDITAAFDDQEINSVNIRVNLLLTMFILFFIY
jgi:hypothetical protein